jgi:ATP-binding cassette, subfamily B, bacterial CvaB/MchF/RaxB
MNPVQWPWQNQLEVQLQSEATECGLASVAMVARHFGHKVNLAGLRKSFPGSQRGSTLDDLMRIGSAIGLSSRALRLELEELGDLQRPCILHWDLNHFVVLESVSARTATILDPASGRRTLSLKKISNHFTGVALEMYPASDFKPITAQPRTKISDLWSNMVDARRSLVQILLLSFLFQITAIVTPFFMQLVIDEAIAQGDVSLMPVIVIGFGVVFLLGALVQALRDWVMLALGESLTFQLSGNVIRHLFRLPMGYFERRHVGDLMSRVSSINPIQELLSKGLIGAAIDAFLMITTLAVMAFISVKLTAVVLGATLLYFLFQQLTYPGLRQRTEEEIFARAGEETYLLESIRSIRAVKLHGSEAQRENGWRNRFASVISAQYRSKLFGIQLELAEQILFTIGLLFVVYLGAGDVIGQKMTVGSLLAFLAYRTNFTQSAANLVGQYRAWRLLSVHLDRLSDIVTEPKEELQAPAPRTPLASPSLALEGVSFAYSPTEKPILNDVNIQIPSGAFVAIIGPSGMGKTTMLRLMLGLLTPTSGRFQIDGVPLGPQTLSHWRARVGAVLQDDYLLSGTFADNISFFDSAMTDERVVQAAEMAYIHDDIMKMPMAYLSVISDMGSALSSGQKQRLLLARALYRDPDVLFLDEGTANLDDATEQQVVAMITKLPITRIVIAHRPAMIAKADIILEFTEDGIVQRSGKKTSAPA